MNADILNICPLFLSGIVPPEEDWRADAIFFDALIGCVWRDFGLNLSGRCETARLARRAALAQDAHGHRLAGGHFALLRVVLQWNQAVGLRVIAGHAALGDVVSDHAQ